MGNGENTKKKKKHLPAFFPSISSNKVTFPVCWILLRPHLKCYVQFLVFQCTEDTIILDTEWVQHKLSRVIRAWQHILQEVELTNKGFLHETANIHGGLRHISNWNERRRRSQALFSDVHWQKKEGNRYKLKLM